MNVKGVKAEVEEIEEDDLNVAIEDTATATVIEEPISMNDTESVSSHKDHKEEKMHKIHWQKSTYYQPPL